MRDIFSIVVDDSMPDNTAAVISDISLTPKVQLTVFEGRSIHTILASDWPPGMSEKQPLATIADLYGQNEVIISGKPVTGIRFEAHLIRDI